MGMYTELIFGARFKSNTPKEVIDTLRHLICEIRMENPLFQTLYHIDSYGFLCCGSYYFGINKSVNKLWSDDITGDFILSSRSNMKNFKNDIERFLEWIKPYIDSGSGEKEMYAIVIYEESDIPTIYYLKD